MCSLIEELGQRFFLGATNVDGFAIDDLRDIRGFIIHVANQDRLRGTDDDTGRLESNIDPVRTEIALLGGMVFGIDKDSVVRTGGHAGFAADADRFIKVDDPVRTLEHSSRRTGRDAGCVRALIAAGNLMRPAYLREHADIHVLDVSARYAYGNDIFRLAGSRTGMATNAACVIDDLGPLHAVVSSCLLLDNHLVT